MYFGSFEVDSHVISETTLLDFLCKQQENMNKQFKDIL